MGLDWNTYRTLLRQYGVICGGEMNDKPSKFLLERDKKDLETWLERAERDPQLFDKDSIAYKKSKLDEINFQLRSFYGG